MTFPQPGFRQQRDQKRRCAITKIGQGRETRKVLDELERTDSLASLRWYTRASPCSYSPPGPGRCTSARTRPSCRHSASSLQAASGSLTSASPRGASPSGQTPSRSRSPRPPSSPSFWPTEILAAPPSRRPGARFPDAAQAACLASASAATRAAHTHAATPRGSFPPRSQPRPQPSDTRSGRLHSACNGPP